MEWISTDGHLPRTCRQFSGWSPVYLSPTTLCINLRDYTKRCARFTLVGSQLVLVPLEFLHGRLTRLTYPDPL